MPATTSTRHNIAESVTDQHGHHWLCTCGDTVTADKPSGLVAAMRAHRAA